MAKYTTKRKYTKKPTTQLKRVVKRVKKETVEAVQATAELPEVAAPVIKSYLQKAIDWLKGIAG